MCSRGKQRYYAAIVQEAAARRAREEIPSLCEEVLTMEECTYDEIGRKSLAAFSNLLDILSGTKSASISHDQASIERRLGDQLASLAASLEVVRRDLAAFASRTDRVLLDLLKRMEAQEDLTSTMGSAADSLSLAGQAQVMGAAGRQAGPGTGRAGGSAKTGTARGKYERVPKEQTKKKILEAARELAASGRKVTLAECARLAGVAYYKAVYACKDSDELAGLMVSSE